MSETVLTLKNASIYQQETLVLSDVNLDFKKGDFLYLIGQTGSGKSSLLKILYGDLELKVGTGEIAGFKLEELTLKQLLMITYRLFYELRVGKTRIK